MTRLKTAAILSVGDELVLGQTVDTNSAWISQRLAAVGVDVKAHATADDDRTLIAETMAFLCQRHDLLVVSGGLGPTDDDLTREALADLIGGELVRRDDLLHTLEEWFAGRKFPMKESNKRQAEVPVGAESVPNPVGTAPGLSAEHEGCRIVVTPGVPREMRRMVEDHVLPLAEGLGGGAVLKGRTLHTFGRGESDIAASLGALHERGRNPSVGTTVSDGIVSLRLNCRAASAAEADRLLDETEDACRAAVGPLLYGKDGQTLQDVLHAMLDGRTVSTVESCTGGLIAKMLTDTPGSSAHLSYGWVTYGNEAKAALGVEIGTGGAVCEDTVRQMAERGREHAGSTFCLATSGIAGPGGATADKPVGHVWLALATPDGTQALQRTFPGDRAMVRDRTAKTALQMLRLHLMGERYE